MARRRFPVGEESPLSLEPIAVELYRIIGELRAGEEPRFHQSLYDRRVEPHRLPYKVLAGDLRYAADTFLPDGIQVQPHREVQEIGEGCEPSGSRPSTMGTDSFTMRFSGAIIWSIRR